MTRWDAYYYDGLGAASAPSRIMTIEAENEDEAGRIAVAGMVRSMRVHVTQRLWGDPTAPVSSSQTLDILRDDDDAGWTNGKSLISGLPS